ncbi:transcriptional regulator [Candidatus Scalindua japonica]|uniref:Transcriptional regulator n=1 Tax=Candidatus Scalindua japonica TaxID=1284222 RepID=A0A286U3U7_9BACT|nr:type II toxin-antitoxin system ParD family antitoxin [Candidatus Scalindua japonica]GAX62803.1 transcriptional regulator [Candidatus Scalindua japonica]
MSRTSISFTPPYDEWIKSQIKREEFRNKSDVINDLIRKARKELDESEYISAKLIKSEKSGFLDKFRDEILAGFKDRLRHNGELCSFKTVCIYFMR